MLSLINSEDRCRPPFYMEWELATDLSLQGLLDCDIKSETENVIGGNPDLDLSMIQMASFQPVENLTNEHVSNWIGVQSMLNGNSNHSNIDYYMDFMGCDAASVMVNPNAVVPDVTGRSPTRSNSLVSSTTNSPPASTERHFPFGSASHQQQQAQQKSGLDSEELPELPPEFNDLGDLGVLNGLGDLNGIDLGNFDNVGGIEGSIDFVVEPEPTQPEPETPKVQNKEILTDCSSDSSLSSSVPSPSSIGSIKLRFPANKPKATVLVPASTLKSMSPQLLKIQQQQQQTLKVNGIAGLKVQNFKIIQSPNNQVQQLCRQIYNNNVQLANQQQAAEQQAAEQQAAVHQAAVQQAAVQQQQQLKQQKLKKQRPRPQIKKVNRAPTPPNTEKDKDRPAFIEMVDKNGQVIIMKNYPKPGYSYSCLIAMALKNSVTGSLPVSEIYTFMCNHFPYFKTAPSGWKNSVRHNLSLNKCFQKMEKPPGTGTQRKGCLWGIHPAKAEKMDEELNKWTRKDPESIRNAMVDPENLEVLERGVFFFKDVEMEEDSGSSTVGSENEVGSREAEYATANSLLSDSFDESSRENSEGENQVVKRPYQVEINYQVQTSKRRKRSESDNETQVNSLQCTARRKVTMYLTTE